MNKKELADLIAMRNEITKREAAEMLDMVVDALETAIIDEGKVSLYGFGVFEVKERAKRKGRNPKTQEEITIPARNAVTFTVGKNLKEAVNE